MNARQRIHTLTIAACALIMGTATPAQTAPVHVTVHADKVVRTLDANWFGSGVTYDNAWFQSGIKSPAFFKAMHELPLGMLRWPHGTWSYFYFWDRPAQSYRTPQSRKNKVHFMTPDEMYDAAQKMGAESLVQVNTAQYPGHKGHSFESVKVPMSPLTVKGGAAYAAKWVASAKKKGHHIQWWEIGNEDWVYWTGQQYAAIVNAYAKAMKKADPSIKLIIEGMIGHWDGDFTSSDGPTWMQQLIDHVDRKQINALSVHEYMTGLVHGENRTFSQRVSAMLARVDDDPIRGLIEQLKKNGVDWPIWVTEFNVLEKDPKAPADHVVVMQNVGHALVMADWVGHLLDLGVDRMIHHSLVGHPAFELIEVGRWTTPDKPQFTVPALALMAYTRDFGRQLLSVQMQNNPARLKATYSNKWHQMATNPAPISHAYAAVSAQAAKRAEDGSVRVILINRDLDHSAAVQLSLEGASLKADADIQWKCLGGDLPLDASNIKAPDKVQWRTKTIRTDELRDLELPAHSINLLVLPTGS